MATSTGKMTSAKTRAKNSWSTARWLAFALLSACLGAPALAQTTSGQPATDPSSSGQAQPAQAQPSQTQPTPAQNDSDIPDAPTAQPAPPTPEPPPVPKPEETETKKPVERNPWTNQPINQPAPAEAGSLPGDQTSTPPPMPAVKTLPPGTTAKKSGQDELAPLIRVHTNLVIVPVTVKDKQGRRVDGLLSTDFAVKEKPTDSKADGVLQKLTFFTADPIGLSVAVVLDLGMSDSAVQKVNQTFPAMVAAFAPYDEVAVYTYSSTVSEIRDFSGVTQRLTALLNQLKSERGRDNGPPVLGGPMVNGPTVNGVPVGSPTEPVNTPPKEAHVLNDAILQAALDLSKRDKTRRRVIFVISDGREYGSQASFRDVRRVLLSNNIQVEAIAVEGAALPVYSKLERLHIPDQGYDEILPKYTSATGGETHKELSRNAISDIYAQSMSEARNQYTLGYVPAPLKVATRSACRDIEVIVHHPGLKITAKQQYCPALAVR
jgi:VWFA-related protein